MKLKEIESGIHSSSGYKKPPTETHDIKVAALFPKKQPLEIEIGCGKGKFLITRAFAEPRRNFLGIDWAGKWMNIGKIRSEKRQLQNLRFVKGEARAMMASLPEASVQAFHIYFPDPWPKKRHHKRRFLQGDVLDFLYPKLAARGWISMATDHQDYYEVIVAMINQGDIVWRTMRESVNKRISFPDMKTNYELKYEKANRTLHYLELQK